ncbi:hypothetical protein E3N88_29399 [Mikania micrantha]|uniref:Uncharacterized protein n=1 Tax=Mikania micrantha TaxID=192012 RepID=A0A5N6MJC9_9ASTR|nr:hypothetical protein E3N88_29399 [Mikania micrantha]
MTYGHGSLPGEEVEQEVRKEQFWEKPKEEARVDEKRNEVTENLCSTSCIEKAFKYRSHNETLIKEVTKLKYFNSEFLKNKEIFKKKLDAERRDISMLKELLSDKESNYRDAKRQIAKITLELEQVKTGLSKTKIRVEKYDYSSNLVAKMIDVEIRGREPMGLGYSEVKPPFNHNYSIMPKINKSVDDLLLKSDRMCEFTIGSDKPVSLTVDPILSDLNRSNDSEVCVEDLSVSSRKKVTKAHSTITKETGSKLNPNCEPYVPNRFWNKSPEVHPPGQSDCDIKHFHPQEFYQKWKGKQKGKPQVKPNDPGSVNKQIKVNKPTNVNRLKDKGKESTKFPKMPKSVKIWVPVSH